jgi:hypothetical protein
VVLIVVVIVVVVVMESKSVTVFGSSRLTTLIAHVMIGS